MRLSFALTAALLALPALAEPVKVEATLETVEQIRMEFQDGSKHFVALVRREGTAEGEGPFDGATVVEHGWHDVDPPHGGHPQGYLEITTPHGDIAYLKFTVRAVFLGGGEKPKLTDHGFWELTSGTGRFADMRGLGTVVIHPGEKTGFTIEGELAPKP